MALGIGTIVGLGANLLGGIFGAGQKAQANRLEKANRLPIAQVNQNIANNAALAKNLAQVGMAEQQYNNALTQQQQNLIGVLSSASRTGRNINVASILRQANQGTQNLNVADEQARRQNQLTSYGQNQALAQEQQRVWNWNIGNPYLKTAQQVASLRNAGNQNIFGALGGVAQMGIMGAFDDQGGGQTGNQLPPIGNRTIGATYGMSPQVNF